MHSITRRGLLRNSAFCATGLALGKTAFSASPATESAALVPLTLDTDTLAHYVDPLPIPPIAQSSGFRPSPMNPALQLPFYRMAMRQVETKIHRDLHPTRMWGFGPSSPGPTFEARSGQGLIVEWANELPTKHFLPIDHNLEGAEACLPAVRSVIHLHGGKTPPGSDGYPEDWCVPGKSLIYHYPIRQDACMLFYHDHAMGINRLNIYAGLFGLFFIRDEREDALELPRGEYEVPLVVCDRILQPDGQLYYPDSGIPGAPWLPEVFGNSILVNSALFPYLDVEPRKYRLRILNGSNGRFYRFSFGQEYAFQVIGTDQGFLGAPSETKQVLMAPAERIDVIFDFGKHAGEKILLRSDTFELMEFRVAGKKSARLGTQNVPSTIVNEPGISQSTPGAFVRLTESQAIRTRRLTLDEHLDPAQQSLGMFLNNTPWRMPITEKPVIDTIEIWELVNLTQDSHPIHLHLVRFQILDRRTFDIFDFMDTRTFRFTGPAVPPDSTEAGWKDTVRVDSGVVTRIIVPFTGFTGRYVWHCHVLEHEDNEMMRPYEVVAG